MRYQFITCRVLQREAYHCAAKSQNEVDIVLLPQGLHNTPDKLRSEVQQKINNTTDVEGNTYDATLLGYGLCSNGIVGLTSTIPLVVARAHDCITLILGSKEKYQQYFDSHRGVYWYTPGWINTNTQPGPDRYNKTLKEYQDKYGPDNAEYLMTMEQNWMKEYSWATYIDWNLPNNQKEIDYTEGCAKFMGWNFETIKGDPALMQNLFDGNWNENDFLVVPPHHQIAEDLTKKSIICSCCKNSKKE